MLLAWVSYLLKSVSISNKKDYALDDWSSGKKYNKSWNQTACIKAEFFTSTKNSMVN